MKSVQNFNGSESNGLRAMLQGDDIRNVISIWPLENWVNSWLNCTYVSLDSGPSRCIQYCGQKIGMITATKGMKPVSMLVNGLPCEVF
jgi:hypothetical protein